jgi:hypothetical protein
MKKQKKWLVILLLIVLLLLVSVVVKVLMPQRHNLKLERAGDIEALYQKDSLAFQEATEVLEACFFPNAIPLWMDSASMSTPDTITFDIYNTSNVCYYWYKDTTADIGKSQMETSCIIADESIAELFQKYQLWGIRCEKTQIRIVFEYSKTGFAAELVYVFEKNERPSSPHRIIKEEDKISDHWFALITYEPEYSP